MMFLAWTVFLPINLIMLFAAYLLAPILPLFASDDGWLPNSLAWFQTPDNSLDSDEGWQTHFTWIKNRYIRRVLWLWRNPAYGFDNTVLSLRIPANSTIEYYGNNYVSDNPLTAGWVFRTITKNEELIIWQFYTVIPYRFFSLRCIRINLGWKLWGNISVGQTKQFVCSFNPWMKCQT